MGLKSHILRSRTPFLLLFVARLGFAAVDGAPPGRSGSPADGGQTCAACHSSRFPENYGPGWLTIRTRPFESGVSQTVGIEVNDPAAVRWGFQITARLASNEAQQAGSFRATATSKVFCASGGAPPCSAGAEFAGHVAPSTQGAEGTTRLFTVEWIPPSPYAGPVVFHAAAVAGDGNGSPAGDLTYTTRALVDEYFARRVDLHSANTPAGKGTAIHGINASGQTTGVFYDNGRERGFLRSPERIVTAFDTPGAQTTVPFGINDQGEIVGVADDTVAFLRRANGTFLSFQYPGATRTVAYGINASGTIVGAYRQANQPERGFVRSASGAFTSVERDPQSTQVRGVNNQEDRVELVTDQGRRRILASRRSNPGDLGNFLFDPSSVSINNRGRIAGTDDQEGFLELKPFRFYTFTVDGKPTEAWGMNDDGVIVGSAVLTAGVSSGYIVKPCTQPVSPSQRVHGSGLETNQIWMTGNCPWFADSDVPWISVEVVKRQDVDDSSLVYSVMRNDGPARTGRIRVGGQTVNVLQAAVECQYQIYPDALTFVSEAGENVTFTVSTSPGCAWTVDRPFTDVDDRRDVVPTPMAGYGTGTVRFTIPRNQSYYSGRRWETMIAGRWRQIYQYQRTCTYWLDSTQATAPALGRRGEIRVKTPSSSCSWTATSDSNWLTISATRDLRSEGSVLWAASPNTGPTPRTGHMTIGGQTVTVNQLPGVGCPVAPASDSQAAPASGGAYQVAVATLPGCFWIANTATPWITLTTASGSNGASMSFQVAANPLPSPRWGVVRVADQVFTVQQAGQSSVTGLRFVPVAPCRLVDTRGAPGLAGAFGPPKLAAGGSREISVSQGRCGIPASARAYSLNLTVVPDGYLGYASLVPKGFAGPAVSTLNSWNGRVVANAAIVPAGADGAILAYVSDAAHVIVDVNGYFADPTDPSGLDFLPIAPCRIADTRTDRPYPFGKPRLEARTWRSFPVAANPSCPIPPGALAYSLNATVVPAGTLGYLTLWPASRTQPLVSTLNSSNGQIVANAAIVPVGADDSIGAYVSDASDLLFDLNGALAPQGSPNGMKFHPLPPCRLMDTRAEAGLTGPFGPPRLIAWGSIFRVPVQSGRCGVPATARAYSLNVTVVPDEPLPYLTLWPDGLPVPGVSTLNAYDGQVTANAAIVPAGTNGTIQIAVTATTHVILDLNGYFAP